MDCADHFFRPGNGMWRGRARHPVGDHRDTREELSISPDRDTDKEDAGPADRSRILRHLLIIGQYALLKCVRCDQRAHELIHCRGGGEVQLTAELSLIILIVPYRCAPVALGEVNADDDPVGTFAE